MIDLVDRRRSDDAMATGVYISVAAHSFFVLAYREKAVVGLPGGELSLYVWAALSIFACLSCLFALLRRSEELERSGLTLLTATVLAYGIFEMVAFTSAAYPFATSPVYSFAFAIGLFHQALKKSRVVKANKRIAKMAEKNPDLKRTIVSEGREIG